MLRNRNLALLLSGRVISTGGDWFYQVALSVAIFRFSHGNSFDVSLLWIVRLIPALLLGPVGGSLADRLGYRRAMLTADLARMLLVLGLAIVLRPGNWAVIYVVAFFVTSFYTLFRPGSVAIIPLLVNSRDERLAANASAMQADSLAGIVGSAFGGALAGAGLITQLLYADAGTFAVSALALWLLRPRAVAPAPTTEAAAEVVSDDDEMTGGVRGVLRLVQRRPLLVFSISSMAVPEIASGAVMVWIVPFAVQSLKLGNGGIGFLYSAFGAGAFIGGFVAASVAASIRLEKLLAISVAAAGAAVALLGLSHVAVLAIVFILVYGLTETVEYASYETLLQQAVPEGALGRATGTIDSFLFNMMLLGTLASGLLAGAFGVNNAMLGIGCLVLLATGVAWWNFRRTTMGQPNVATLATIPAFAGVSPEIRAWAVRRMTRERFPRGEVIIRQGERGDRFYTIAGGRVEVEIASDGGATSRELGAGDYFGEIALLHNVPRTATVQAVEPTILWSMSREDFEELQTRASEFRDSIWTTATSRMETGTGVKMALATRN